MKIIKIAQAPQVAPEVQQPVQEAPQQVQPQAQPTHPVADPNAQPQPVQPVQPPQQAQTVQPQQAQQVNQPQTLNPQVNKALNAVLLNSNLSKATAQQFLTDLFTQFKDIPLSSVKGAIDAMQEEAPTV